MMKFYSIYITQYMYFTDSCLFNSCLLKSLGLKALKVLPIIHFLYNSQEESMKFSILKMI